MGEWPNEILEEVLAMLRRQCDTPRWVEMIDVSGVARVLDAADFVESQMHHLKRRG